MTALFLDHSLIFYGSAMANSNVHGHKRVPALIAGHASGTIKGNLHVRCKEGTPQANILLTMVQKLGMNIEEIGDSTGPIAILRELKMLVQMILTTLLTFLAPAVGDTRLSDAAMNGDRIAVQTLLSSKADVNAAQGDGTTALHWAAYRDDLDMARLLLKSGANVKATTRLGDYTPLFLAAKNGNAEMIDLLLKAGADVNAVNHAGTTSLMLAAASGKPEAVKVLLDRGANVNAKDLVNGETAVMFAAAMNAAPSIKLLADRGAELNVLSKVLEPRDPNDKRDGINPNRRQQILAPGWVD